MRRRVFGGAGCALGAALALTACAAAPTHGVVRAKQYDAGYTWLMPVSTGKSTILVPEYEPPEWRIELEQSPQLQGWVDVDEATYDRLQVGDRYSVAG